MKSKSILAILGTILAIVLAIFFPNLKSSSSDATTPATTSVDGGGSATRDAAPRANDPAPSQPDEALAAAKKSVAKGTASDVAAKTSGTSTSTTAPKPESKPESKPKSAPTPKPDATPKPPSANDPAAKSNVRRNIGFGSRQAFDDHFAKHGTEFGGITQDQYLALAQDLRDAPVGGNVLEIVRDDGVSSRFDKKSGSFLAFNKNGTIRTFFKPNDGLRYFERQAEKDH